MHVQWEPQSTQNRRAEAKLTNDQSNVPLEVTQKLHIVSLLIYNYCKKKYCWFNWLS